MKRFMILLAVLVGVACTGHATNSEDIGTASVAITLAPANLACLQLSVNGTVIQQYDLVEQANTTFVLTGLPLGNDDFSATGYQHSCGDAGTASWVSVPVAAIVTSQAPVSLTLQMEPAHPAGDSGSATVAVNFESCLPLISEFPALGEGVLGIVAGPDGNMWAASESSSGQVQINVTTLSGSMTSYVSSSTYSPVQDITVGADGNLWFTESTASNIGRITLSGAITEWATTTASSGPVGITSGPDGNIWFTEELGNNIGKITMSGTITEYSIPILSSDPYSITTGADGNLWFSANGKVGKVTTSGSFTMYSVPSSGASNFVTAGPDGNVWYTDNVNNKIGRITPSGTSTMFAAPSAGANPWGITLGPDGNLWFMEVGVNKIGVMSTSGSNIEEFTVPTSSSYARYVTAGPDGNVWFTESSGVNVGRIRVSPFNACDGG